MRKDQVPEVSFGRLIADVANRAAACALLQENVAFGEALNESESAGMASKLERARQRLADAQAALDVAVSTLDAAIGVTPAELEQLAAELRKLNQGVGGDAESVAK